MRPVPSFHLSYPDVRALRIALAAGAVACLVIIAACTDSPTKSVTAPQSIRNATISSGTQGHGSLYGGLISLCVDGNSPAGTYKFRNSGWNSGIALDGSVDPGDGGDGLVNHGSTVWGNGVDIPDKLDNSEYTVAKGTSCVLLVNRTQPSLHYSSPDPVDGFAVATPPDDFQAINITATTIPSTAVYDSTNCVTSDGLTGIYAPQPGPCGHTNNPTRALMNYDHGIEVTFAFRLAPVLQSCSVDITANTDNAGYPDASHNPRSGATFAEAIDLTGFAIHGGELHAFYSDEHALTLGVDSVFVKNKSPTPSVAYSFSKGYASYKFDKMTGIVSNSATVSGSPYVNVGRTSALADPAGIANPVDGAPGGGRPLYPALFVTDLTAVGDINSRAGDWQQGSNSGLPPTTLYGSWKGAVITVDNTKNPATTTLTPRADPAKNHKVLGFGDFYDPGGGAPTVEPFKSAPDLGYSTDVVWNLAAAIPYYNSSHSYRAVFMVHDGDQNKTGGDVGEACINIVPSS